MIKENIGIWWFGHELKDKDQTGKIWWGVCKKTKKLAFCSLLPFVPMVISSTHITTDDKCFDSNCLNCDCQFNTNKTFVEGMKHTCFNEVGTGESQIKFIGKAIKLINEYFADLTDEDYKEHFVDGYESTTISEDAFISEYGLEE